MASSAIGNVSDTAFWIAHWRAVESARADALFRDPFAERLAGERGKRIAKEMPAGAMTGWLVAIRTRIIDEYIQAGIAEGADTVVNLGAGLDARPYRMELPGSLRWIEADYPATIEYKAAQLAGETARCQLERVKIDLSDLPSRRALLERVDGSAKKWIVLTEGVIPYLTEEQVGALADELRQACNLRYWIAEYISPIAQKFRRRGKLAAKLQNAPFQFYPKDWFGFFAEHGWRTKEMHYLAEDAQRLRRPPPFPAIAKAIYAIRAMFASKGQREAFRKFMGYALMEPAAATHDREHFEKSYGDGAAPWDIGRPQPAIAAAAGKLSGSVVDSGCGTGENTLMLASRGLRATGVDFVESAIAAAKEKAVQRGIAATFLVKDALQLGEWDERFDGAIDSGVFHLFSDEDRAKYVAGLRAVVRPGGRLLLLCFSDATPGDAGPRRVKREELERAFAAGWEIESIEATHLAIREEAKHIFGGEDPRAWLLTARRK